MPRVPLAALLCAGAAAAQSFVNFESPLVAPIRLSADGLRLYAAHTADNRLAVYGLLDPDHPVLLAEIPVGLEPVSVNARTDDEVWVVNHLSDSVSIVSLAAGRVVATLRVPDEPSDVVFAGGKAFVSTATNDAVQVFDVSTRASLGSVPVFGKDPRALAVDPTGTKVYAVIARSGNGTTVLPQAVAPAQPPPTNTSLPTPPRTGMVIRADDPTWAAQIPYSLPDDDVAEIDVAAQTVTRYFAHVGTTNTAIAVHPVTGELWVANIEARNLVRFEPNLRGHAIDSRVTRIAPASGTVTPFDLNPGLDYSTLPNPAALATALAEPFGVAIDATAGRVYVAAQGTDRVGVLDLSGNVLARIEVGVTPGAVVDTRHKRGPRGLALAAATHRLYVLDKLSASIGIVDTTANALLGEVPLGSFDPTPASIRDGRKFLYDCKLSGNGTMSCASCHVDGDLDGIAWDLGDPAGNLASAPSQPFPFNLGLTSFHPMKGPMTTQTLKGLSGMDPLHWRGDRANFQAFNPAFGSLLGGAPLSTADINAFAAFATAIAFPPNPNQQLDRSLLSTPAGTNQQAGFTAFTSPIATLPLIGAAGCFTCHALPTGSNRMVISGTILQEPQQFKVPQLRNLYRKTGFARAPGPQKSGFGYTHDGTIDNLTTFLQLPQFNSWPTNVKDDIGVFLMVFDTGTAPLVGYQVTVDQANANSANVTADLNLLTARAAAGDIDLVAIGTVQGAPHGLLWDTAAQVFRGDTTGFGPFTLTQLRAQATAGQTALTCTGVPPHTGNRIALDRDLDGALDGDERPLGYGTGTAGCPGMPAIAANAEPRLGNTAFAFVGGTAPASGYGFFALGFAAGNLPIAGITLLVDTAGPPVVVFLPADARGVGTYPLPIPAQVAFAGMQLFAQFAWLDACAPSGLSASAGLQIAVRPQ